MFAFYIVGFGLWLQRQAERTPGVCDRAEPHRLLTDLGPYEHLLRIFRLCTIHFERNIRKISDADLASSKVTAAAVRDAMHSLSSAEPLVDLEGTLGIIREGGKRARGNCAEDVEQDVLTPLFS